MQHDPYDQFASGYVGMGNDPGNGVDPSGGVTGGLSTPGGIWNGSFLSPFKSGGSFLSGAFNITSGVGTGISILSTTNNVARLINSIGQNQENLRQVRNKAGLIFGFGDIEDWQPFNKADLIQYLKSRGLNPTENNLGGEFEKIFENYVREASPEGALLGRFRKLPQPWTEGDVRNSQPDFESDDISLRNGRRYLGTQAYEVKQNNGRGIYLSSNEQQVKAHISNHAARNQGNLDSGIKPGFTLVTTSDVKFSSGISRYANGKKVTYTHVRSEYKIVNGQYRFRFKSAGLFEQVAEFFKELF